tara:strand:+ start:5154 stop:5663 length:510 start_codon:yes stop_codon:yes gene_type:complete
MFNTGLISASGRAIYRSARVTDKFGTRNGYLATLSSNTHPQTGEDGTSADTVIRWGNITNRDNAFVINGNYHRCLQWSENLASYYFTLSNPASLNVTLSQNSFTTLRTALGTMPTSQAVSCFTAGSGDLQFTRWTWTLGQNGFSTNIMALTSSTDAAAGNYKYDFVSIE